jgi:membrane-associated phospholipid phosphatase
VLTAYPYRLAGLLLIVITLALSIAAAGDGTLPGDVAIARFIQRAPQPPAQSLADFGNWIGSARVFGVITAVLAMLLLVLRRPWDAAIVFGAYAARLFNGLLKAIVDSPRPSADQIRVTSFPGGLGFPSGHAMGAMLGFGAIAIVSSRLITNRRWRRAVQIACAVLILDVGFARIYVGAHWPSDVIGGYLWGAILLTVVYFSVVAIERRVTGKRSRAPRILAP